MAGMLPGVECARRRRCGSTDLQKSNLDDRRTRRSSFCLYTSSSYGTSRQSTHLSSCSQRLLHSCTTRDQWLEEGEAAGIAREAKQRLDKKLGTQVNSGIRRHNSLGDMRPISQSESRNKSRGVDENESEGLDSPILGIMQREVIVTKKSSRKFSWAKLGWKASEQEECAVCLEYFKSGEVLVHLPCAHRFHSCCMLPWLRNHSICPCCRMKIMVQKPLDCRV